MTNIFKNLSIKLKLTLTCISIVTLSLVIFTAVILMRSSHIVTRLAEKNVQQSLSFSTQHIETLIKDVNTRLLTFQAKESVQRILSDKTHQNPDSDLSTLEQNLFELDIFQSLIQKSELYLLTEETNLPIPENTQFVFSDASLKNDPWYNSVLKSGSGVYWQIQDNYNSAHSYAVASKIIYDVNTKKPMAILKATIDLNLFTDALNSITLADTGKIFLCAGTHIINNFDSSLGIQLTNNKVIAGEMLCSGKEETRTIIQSNDKWMIKSYPLSGTGLYVLGAVKINEFNTAQKSIAAAIIVTGAVLTLLALSLALFISRIIVKPLLKLTGQMNNYRLEHSNAIYPNSKDEIGFLFESFNTMDKTIHSLIDERNRESEIRKTAELKALQAQITPHFLYNTLNSIGALAKRYGAKDIEKMTVALSRFFMKSLNNGVELLSINDELEQLMSYVYLQKIRYGEKFDVITDIPDELLNYSICKLTLQPLVENCIYHAFTDIDYKGIIKISAEKAGGKIYITVSDNGIGDITVNFKKINEYVNKSFDFNEPIEKYGIHNIAQRIKLYFGNDCGLKYSPNPNGGLNVCITINAKLCKIQNGRASKEDKQ